MKSGHGRPYRKTRAPWNGGFGVRGGQSPVDLINAYTVANVALLRVVAR
jgi:hypothetical protein